MGRPTLRTIATAAGWTAVGAVAVESARRARTDRVGPGEERAFRWFNERSDRIAVPAWAVMQSGSLGAVFATAGVVARRRDVRAAAPVALVGTTVWVGAKAVKPLVGRGRPEEYLARVLVRGRRQSGLGYPSGHAVVALTLALTVPPVLGVRRCSTLGLAAVGTAAATGAARMYVGAHLPLDVAGGFALGIGGGWAATTFLERIGVA
jgi:membrane-associated phospholipid phosphatase